MIYQKQDSDGSWRSLNATITQWYDSDVKKEYIVYDHFLHEGKWYSYVAERKVWCENGKLSADLTGTYTITDDSISSSTTGPTYPCQ